jgi:hypothetical protein
MWPEYVKKQFDPVTALGLVLAAVFIFLAVAGVTLLVLVPAVVLAAGVLLWMRSRL